MTDRKQLVTLAHRLIRDREFKIHRDAFQGIRMYLTAVLQVAQESLEGLEGQDWRVRLDEEVKEKLGEQPKTVRHGIMIVRLAIKTAHIQLEQDQRSRQHRLRVMHEIVKHRLPEISGDHMYAARDTFMRWYVDLTPLNTVTREGSHLSRGNAAFAVALDDLTQKGFVPGELRAAQSLMQAMQRLAIVVDREFRS